MGKTLALLYIASPALPIGSFSWSRGLEPACQSGAVQGLDDLADFLAQSLRHGLGSFDLPLLAMSMPAAAAAAQGGSQGASEGLERLIWLNDLSLAGRESREFGLEEEEGGKAVKRLCLSLGLWPSCLPKAFVPGLVVGQAILATCLGLGEADRADVLESLAFAWLQNQVAAAARTLSLGQSELQNLVLSLGPEVTRVAHKALQASPRDLGQGLVGLAILSARHELELSRLFRS
ncbi:MAG: urease accessory protein UreF [Deltaproteobacteria bacterium]|nr:urease accessory protein UreF [Deltaproteobacteria bacterium]